MGPENKDDRLIKQFAQDLEGLANMDGEQLARLVNAKHGDLLLLAQKIAQIDFSVSDITVKTNKDRKKSKTKPWGELLRKHRPVTPGYGGELDDAELDLAAGGRKTDPDNPFRDEF